MCQYPEKVFVFPGLETKYSAFVKDLLLHTQNIGPSQGIAAEQSFHYCGDYFSFFFLSVLHTFLPEVFCSGFEICMEFKSQKNNKIWEPPDSPLPLVVFF
jgi:hypothetical protein